MHVGCHAVIGSALALFGLGQVAAGRVFGMLLPLLVKQVIPCAVSSLSLCLSMVSFARSLVGVVHLMPTA